MSTHVETLVEQAKTLTVQERIELLDALHNLVSPPDPDWEAAWAEEALRRMAAVERGEMALIDAEEVHARLRAKFVLK